MDTFLDLYNPPRLNLGHLNRPITMMETESVIRALHTKKYSGLNGFTTKLHEGFQ